MRAANGKMAATKKDGFYVSPSQAAYALETSYFSIQRWFDEGLLEGVKLPGGKRKPTVEGVRKFAKAHGYTMERFETRLKEALAQTAPPKRTV